MSAAAAAGAESSLNIPLVIAGVVGVSSIVCDAIGISIKTRLVARQRRAWQTANNYHMSHSAVLLGIALMMSLAKSPESKSYLTKGYYCVLAGALGFGGSIYGLCLRIAPKWLGPMTPTSGLILTQGWVYCGLAGLYW